MVYGDEFDLSPQLLDKFDWFFAPLLNPDGYEYSHATVSSSFAINIITTEIVPRNENKEEA